MNEGQRSGAALELLAPARDLAVGIEAINHGADAVYIGGPAFGARGAASNSVADIGKLATHAHRFSARVFVALNTLFRDDELAAVERLAHQLYEAGADALIVQDMGLLELDLPPIALHASTQTDNRTPEKVQFLESVGFSQIVLARELSLAQIAEISARTSATLEFFVHGALCVAFSGQCFISYALTGRSANRGECAQLCRLPWSLAHGDGSPVAMNRHLLSLKDNDQSANLRALVDAGVRSFKIEGRLKDAAYVKNITAHYRRQIDRILDERPDLAPASDGRCQFLFTPDPRKTFNRGATDYFVNGRQVDIACFDSPKHVGESVGSVSHVARGAFDISTTVDLHNGDGLSFFTAAGELTGLRINRAERAPAGFRIFSGDGAPAPAIGSEVFRNLDYRFEKALAKKTVERQIAVSLNFSETPEGYSLALTDEEGHVAVVSVVCAKELSQRGESPVAAISAQLSKLGATIFTASNVTVDLSQPWFVPVSVLNALRRDAVERIEAIRAASWRRLPRRCAAIPAAVYPERELSYLGNVLNTRARDFYSRHGVERIADAFESNQGMGSVSGSVSLMITKHCLRYSFNLCPKQSAGIRPEPMFLTGAGEKLVVRFDCKRCEMHVIGQLRGGGAGGEGAGNKRRS